MTLFAILYRIKSSPALSRVAGPFKNIVKAYMARNDSRHPLRRLNRMHKIYYKRPLDLDNPRTLYDKIATLEFCTDTSLWTRLTDKVAMRDFVTERGYAHLLNEVYAVLDELPPFDDFVAALTRQCVVKTSHSGGSEGVFIIRDKETADLQDIYRKLRESLADNYGARTGQPHYVGIKPRIIIEKLLVNDRKPDAALDDFKFFCINGEPEAINVISDRNLETKVDTDQYYHTDMTLFDWGPQNSTKAIPAPDGLQEMIAAARDLAKGFPFVRVDFYQTGGKVVLGELTFTPGFDFFIGTVGEEKMHWGERTDISAVPRTGRVTADMF